MVVGAYGGEGYSLYGRQKGRDMGSGITFKGMLPVTYFL
jgi:hypothetical protein